MSVMLVVLTPLLFISFRGGTLVGRAQVRRARSLGTNSAKRNQPFDILRITGGANRLRFSRPMQMFELLAAIEALVLKNRHNRS